MKGKVCRYILIIITFAFMIGCAGLNEKTISFVEKVQEFTRSSCSVVPSAKTLSSLVAIMFPQSLPVNAALVTANEICNAYTEQDVGFESSPGEKIEFNVRGAKIVAIKLP